MPVAAYRIVCVGPRAVGQRESHVHIVRIGTGDDQGCTRHWSLDLVLAAMEDGDVFYTQGKASGKIASVMIRHCTECNQAKIIN